MPFASILIFLCKNLLTVHVYAQINIYIVFNLSSREGDAIIQRKNLTIR